MGLMTLLPSVVDAVKSFKIPVIAAGGIVDARGYVACLALGAQGICMGTRFTLCFVLQCSLNVCVKGASPRGILVLYKPCQILESGVHSHKTHFMSQESLDAKIDAQVLIVSQNTHCKQTTKFRSLSHGICRFLATLESYAHPLYKQKILEASSGDTEYTNLYGRARWPGAPHRTLRTPFFETWKNKLAANENELNQPIIGQSTIFERVSKTPNTSIDCCQY
jgi:hypothetical protein